MDELTMLPDGAVSAALSEAAALLAADPWLRERRAAVVCEEQADLEARVARALGAAGGLLLTVALESAEGFGPAAEFRISVTAMERCQPNRARSPWASAPAAAWRAAQVLNGRDWIFERLDCQARDCAGGGLSFTAAATFRGILGRPRETE